jgi:hypothetical protein
MIRSHRFDYLEMTQHVEWEDRSCTICTSEALGGVGMHGHKKSVDYRSSL